MKGKELIERTVMVLDDSRFEALKAQILDNYVELKFFESKDVTREIFAEKLYDYFLLIIFNNNSQILKMFEAYCKDLKKTLNSHIEKTGRARDYFNMFFNNKKYEDDLEKLVDLSRIFLCMYREIMKSGEEKISDFDFAFVEVNIDEIETSLCGEEFDDEETIGFMGLSGTVKPFAKAQNKKHDLDDFELVLLIIMYYYIDFINED